MNRETMRRQGFVPYGPSRAGAEALSMIMAEDLRPHGVSVNLLLPGGATDTGMIPVDTSADVRAGLLSPDVMGPPIVFLASPEAEGVTGQRHRRTGLATLADRGPERTQGLRRAVGSKLIVRQALAHWRPHRHEPPA